MTFLEQVRGEIERRGMPQAVLARRAGVSRQTIHVLLKGEPVSESTSLRVARVLDIPYDIKLAV